MPCFSNCSLRDICIIYNSTFSKHIHIDSCDMYKTDNVSNADNIQSTTSINNTRDLSVDWNIINKTNNIEDNRQYACNITNCQENAVEECSMCHEHFCDNHIQYTLGGKAYCDRCYDKLNDTESV